jgi:hypothetical protein
MSAAIRVTGIVSTSRNYTGLAGVAVHEMVLTQPGDSLPTLVRREFGPSPASHLIAWSLAHEFRTGHRATVTASGWRFNAKRHMLELIAPDHCEHAPAPEAEAHA